MFAARHVPYSSLPNIPWRQRSYHRRLFSQGPISAKHLNRLQRLNERLPRIVRRWTTPLLHAPASQVFSFLILHEATAVVPLFGLVGAMHYTSWLPPMAESPWVIAGVEKFGRYARRKGWLQDSDISKAERQVTNIQQENQAARNESHAIGEETGNIWQYKNAIWDHSETGVRWLIEFATAWAIVKALLIPRLALSVWATPWFARLAVEPTMKILARNGGRLFGRNTTKAPVRAHTAPRAQSSIKDS